jgi:hypothetical protein
MAMKQHCCQTAQHLCVRLQPHFSLRQLRNRGSGAAALLAPCSACSGCQAVGPAARTGVRG